ncbi:MAG TPA: phosphate acyltransferase [Candidatus Eisenbacteria bacterium]|jgi:malate dehydrogenase (oxaloacetate-decarboxylating)(NADP+)
MIRREDSLEYHAADRPGKIELRPTTPCLTPREMRLAYLPGASFPSEAIVRDPSAVFRYTSRGNLVGVVTNGTAVPGLGMVGPSAAKPMQEGIAVLMKRLADIDVFDLEIDTADPDRFVETVRMLEPTFGGINLKDVRAPEGLYIYDRLNEALRIPVFHENLYSSAVVAAAALLNALDLVEKRIGEIRLVICGAGTLGIGCGRLLLAMGLSAENLLVYDHRGLLHPDRDDLNEYQRAFARADPARRLEEGVRGADVFLGASAGGVLGQEMVRSMARFPVVFALAFPEPEIGYDAARASRRDVIVATAFDQHPNAVLDLLSFPYIFRGALDVQATRITQGMLIAAARALADLAREDVVEEVERAYGNERFSFGPEYLLPKPIDPRILIRESAAVAEQAVAEGVARRPLEREAYQESLTVRLGAGRETMRALILRARQEKVRVVFSEGSHPTVLRACAILVDEGIASPVLLGREEEVREAIGRLSLDLRGVPVVDPARSPRSDAYVEQYFRIRARRGVIRAAAAQRLLQRDYFAAMMLHSGDADLMIAGVSTHYVESLRTILDVIGPAPGTRRVSSCYMVLLPKDVVFLADCAVNVEPAEADLAEIALLAARTARSLGVEPRVAMLSFSNFGSVEHAFARKMRRATEIAKERAPELTVDGEMQLATALNRSLRREYFPFSSLDRDANVLIFPDLQSGNLAMHLLQYVGSARPIGPILMGTRRPAQLLQYGATVEEVVNLTTVGVVEAAALRRAG